MKQIVFKSTVYKNIPYAFYAETAYKQALALVENNGNKVEIKKRWIVCKGNKSDKGNRGIKFHVFQDHVEVKFKDPWGKWVHGKATSARSTYHCLKS